MANSGPGVSGRGTRFPGGNARYGIITDLIEMTGWQPERVYSAFSSADGSGSHRRPDFGRGINCLVWRGKRALGGCGFVCGQRSPGSAAVPLTLRPELPPATFLADVRAGWRYLRSRELLVRFFTLIVFVNMTAVPLAAVVIPKIARDHYDSSRAGGLMLAGDGLGVICGGLILA